MTVKLYTTHCPMCEVLASKLKAKDIDYEICDDLEEITRLGFTVVPVLKVGEQFFNFKEALRLVNELA